MMDTQPKIRSRKWDVEILRDFEIQTDDLNSARWLNLEIVNKKKRTCWIVEFTVPAKHRVKLKESEKRNIYSSLA